MTAQTTSVANAFETTLTAPVTDGDLTFPVGTVGVLTSPCYLVIDPDNPTKREYVLFDGTFTATDFVTTAVGNRGLTGSSSGAQSHAKGAKVRSSPLAQHVQDLNDRVDLRLTETESNAAYLRRIAISPLTHGATGDGVADDTTAVAAAFTAARTANLPVLIDAKFLTDTIDYQGESIIGVGDFDKSQIIGKASQDVLHLNSGYTAVDGRAFWRDFVIVVNDTVNAAASFPDRGGVGNAGLAIDYADGLTAPPGRPFGNGTIQNVRVQSSSLTVGGQNNSVGFYGQWSPINRTKISNLMLYRLAYGWWDDFPRVNLTSVEHYTDHNHFDTILGDNCGYQIRRVNAANETWSNLVLHGQSTSTGLIFRGEQSSTRGECIDISVDTLFIESHGTPWDLSGLNRGQFANVNVAGPSGTIVIACRNSDFDGAFFSKADNAILPILSITGNRNILDRIDLPGTTSTYGGRDNVSDTGIGNRVRIRRWWNGGTARQPEWAVPDTRTLHEVDAVSPLLGHVDPPFVSGSDLLLHPHTFVPVALVEDTDYEYRADSDAHFGHALRLLTAGGSWYVQQDSANGKYGLTAGSFVPLGKVRIYVNAKLATAGTQAAILYSGSPAVNRGSKTLSWGTTYSTQWFDADLSAAADGDPLQLTFNNVGGGGATPLDVAWVSFRPFAADLLTVPKATNGNRTAGNLTLNSTSWADVDNTLDITLTGLSEGQKVMVGAQGRWGTEAVDGRLDAVTIVGGSPVAHVGGSGEGMVGWKGLSSAGNVFGASTIYTPTTSDMTNGSLTLRLRYKTSSLTNKTLYGTANNPLNFWAYVVN